jgi:hypothetical protein
VSDRPTVGVSTANFTTTPDFHERLRLDSDPVLRSRKFCGTCNHAVFMTENRSVSASPGHVLVRAERPAIDDDLPLREAALCFHLLGVG